jgi:hypothetical protein
MIGLESTLKNHPKKKKKLYHNEKEWKTKRHTKRKVRKEKERIKQKEDLKEINGGKKKWEDKGV